MKYIGKYSGELSMTMAGWTEPVYFEYEGALRAMKFESLEVRMVKSAKNEVYDPHYIYHARIAGVGRVDFDVNTWGTFNKDFYLSPSAYGDRQHVAEVQKQCEERIPFMQWLAACFGLPEERVGCLGGKHFYEHDALCLVRWKWDGVKAERVAVELPDVVWYDADKGWHFSEPCNFPTDSYATKEACVEANTIRVVEFDDDELSSC